MQLGRLLGRGGLLPPPTQHPGQGGHLRHRHHRQLPHQEQPQPAGTAAHARDLRLVRPSSLLRRHTVLRALCLAAHSHVLNELELFICILCNYPPSHPPPTVLSPTGFEASTCLQVWLHGLRARQPLLLQRPVPHPGSVLHLVLVRSGCAGDMKRESNDSHPPFTSIFLMSLPPSCTTCAPAEFVVSCREIYALLTDSSGRPF